MPTFTATEARSKLYRLIDEAASSHEPIVITGKRGSAVLISEEDYENLLETLHLLSIPGLKESIGEADEEIAQGKTYSVEESFPSDST